MAKDGATKNYGEGGEKARWRREVANDVIGRLGERTKRTATIYLSGPTDEDRSVLRGKGLLNKNLIAVDIELHNVRSVRRTRSPAIHGDLREVLRAWPNDWPVGAVLVDLTCGYEDSVIRSLLLSMLLKAPLQQAVVVFNLQRGRDGSSKEIRDAGAALLGVGKHRGKMVMACLMSCVTRDWKDDPSKWAKHGGTLAAAIRQWYANVEFICRPTYHSYKTQSGNMFDSVVFSMPGPWIGTLEGVEPEVRWMSRRIAAIRATRTRGDYNWWRKAV